MNRLCLLLLFTGLLHYSCQKTDIEVENLNNNVIKVIGHGGMGISDIYPMNSYPSVMKAIDIGANGVEIDVQMTKDGILVAYHDYEMSERSTGLGQIYNQSWDDISQTTYLKPLFADYAVMRLDSLIKGITYYDDIIIVFDYKDHNPDTSQYYLNKYSDALINLIDTFGLADNVYIDCHRTDMIGVLLEKRDDLKIFYYGNEFYSALEAAIQHELTGLTISVDLISADKVAEAHSHGIMVSIFNAHKRSRNRQAIDMNVDFIQTDMLRYLIGLLEDTSHADL